jgi:hypothetical protein
MFVNCGFLLRREHTCSHLHRPSHSQQTRLWCWRNEASGRVCENVNKGPTSSTYIVQSRIGLPGRSFLHALHADPRFQHLRAPLRSSFPFFPASLLCKCVVNIFSSYHVSYLPTHQRDCVHLPSQLQQHMVQVSQRSTETRRAARSTTDVQHNLWLTACHLSHKLALQLESSQTSKSHRPRLAALSLLCP